MSSTDTTEATGSDATSHDLRRSSKRFGDSLFKGISTTSGTLILAILAAVAVFLVMLSMPALTTPYENLQFQPDENGSFWTYVAPYAFGTVWVAILAMVFAVPVAIGIALFISHYAPRKLATGLGYIVDLLSAVPSVVFGLWGADVFSKMTVPLYAWLNKTFGDVVVLRQFFGEDASPTGRTVLTASLVLAVMVLPIITAIAREVFLQTPRLTEEAALALGATRWEVIKTVVLPFGRSGVVAASMLGLGRALGETMAVLMILAPGFTFSWHILEVGRHQSIAANIASRQAEASGVDMSLLIFTGLVLFVLTFIINAIARAIVARSGPKS